MKVIYKYIIIGFVLVLASCTSTNTTELSLAGDWTVFLDSLDVGLTNGWAVDKKDGHQVSLPGTLDDAELGQPNRLKPAMNNYVLSGLTRKHQYIGPAWYQREINIPENWEGKEIELELERVIWESQVYIDGKLVGSDESLITPHRYKLSELLTPGKHLIAIRIDNSNLYQYINVKGNKYPDPINQDMAHAYTNHAPKAAA